MALTSLQNVKSRYRLTGIALRVLLTSMFWLSGLSKLLSFHDAIEEMQHFGLSPAAPIAALVIGVSLVGSLLVIGGRYVSLGALMLAVFTMSTIPVAHDFWNMTGLNAVMEKYAVWEHLTVIGAFLLVALHSIREIKKS
ncbi:Uncharacterized membrane protein YphA, DoxX/SURF4 family [Paraburkholderia steynii]|uniref:Uncharacterized membrane protein YphA, DoxX/SURF4 family n=1 Tax=Paraburkholderia steynii TaxID=1245441 RepID=A0A7Z7BB07_9BURK|nr:DoxX family protein [Paraburkholderia steynii]SDI50676.1 Uncharacterized membrane protein YphA, DoxX/SURF4 family [Paraburkholderia steynii]